jgi:hypothetical protein
MIKVDLSLSAFTTDVWKVWAEINLPSSQNVTGMVSISTEFTIA